MSEHALVAALPQQLGEVEADLRALSEDPDNVGRGQLRDEYGQALAAGRTALSWSVA